MNGRIGGSCSKSIRWRQKSDILFAMEKIRFDQHSSVGLVWIGGWLFTVGYLKLTFWSGTLAVLLWPYDIGAKMAGLG
jgi:hypothetical protein